MTVVDHVTRASSYDRRVAISELADHRQDQAIGAVLKDGFDLDWSHILADPDATDPLASIEDALRREFRRKSFRTTIDALNLSGRLIATFIQQKHEENIGIVKPQPVLTFSEPALAEPSGVLSFWQRLLGLTDADAQALLKSVLAQNTDSSVIADRVTNELLTRLVRLQRDVIARRVAEVGTGTPIDAGDTLTEFIRRARETFPDQSRDLLETEYRTRLTAEYGAARHEQILARQATFPFTQFFAIKDSRTTWFICLPIGTASPNRTGYIAASDDPFWFLWRCPNHYRCRSDHSPIGYREAQRMGILAADGRTKIAVTGSNPNRPFGDPPRLAVNPNNPDDVREVKPAEGFGG